MKKIIALIAIMAFLLCACGGSHPKEKAKLGDKVSTDIADFTLKDAKLSYYASSVSTNYAEPMDSPTGGHFVSHKGYSLVCLTFTITNNDRGNLDVGQSHDWPLKFFITDNGKEYPSKGFGNIINEMFTPTDNGKEYPIKGFDLNDKEGIGGLRLDYGAIANGDDGKLEHEDSSSCHKIIKPNETMTIRVVGITSFDPSSLSDPFDITITVPNSSGEFEKFVYEVK